MSSESHQASTALSVNRSLYQRFSRLNLPRHTSYPSVPFWTNGVDHSVYSNKLRDIAQSHQPVSFYMHVPFCEIVGIEQELAWVNAQAGHTEARGWAKYSSMGQTAQRSFYE